MDNRDTRLSLSLLQYQVSRSWPMSILVVTKGDRREKTIFKSLPAGDRRRGEVLCQV